jgi:hypothetical protein
LLEVAIGLVFVWLGLALACMGVQEWIAALFELRARDLETAIRRMLDEPPDSAPVFKRLWVWIRCTFGGIGAAIIRWVTGKEKRDNTLADKLYDHQLIRALSKRGRKPGYIPSRTFALALFDVVMTAGTDASTIEKALDTWSKKLKEDLPDVTDEALEAVQKALPDLVQLVRETSGDPGLLARLEAEVERVKTELTAQYPDLEPALDKLLQDTTLRQITRGVAQLAASNPRAAQALQGLTAGVTAYAKEGETALAVARTNVETWFNDTMDRLTGWYKRRAQVIAIILGLVFAIGLNADTVVMATTLWREPMIREALVARAQEFEQPEETEGVDPATAIEDFHAQFEGLRLPLGWVPAELDAEKQRLASKKQQCTWKPWASSDEHIEYMLGVPIGEKCWVPLDASKGGIPRDWGYGLSKILGLLISGLAASQGAPFWFDVLKKLTNVRFAGKNPAEEELKKKG